MEYKCPHCGITTYEEEEKRGVICYCGSCGAFWTEFVADGDTEVVCRHCGERVSLEIG